MLKPSATHWTPFVKMIATGITIIGASYVSVYTMGQCNSTTISNDKVRINQVEKMAQETKERLDRLEPLLVRIDINMSLLISAHKMTGKD